MTDYYGQVHGLYGGTLGWSFGIHWSSPSSESSCATDWHNAWNGVWTNGTYGIETLYPTGTTVTETSVATLNSTMHETSKTRTALAIAGTSSADTLPFQEAVVISWRGPNIQRHGRGRMYLPALAEDQVNGDILINAAATRIKSAIDALNSDLTSRSFTFFVTNKKPLKDGTPAFQKTTVTTPLVALKPARQSRRVRKVPTSYV